MFRPQAVSIVLASTLLEFSCVIFPELRTSFASFFFFFFIKYLYGILPTGLQIRLHCTVQRLVTVILCLIFYFLFFFYYDLPG